MLTRIYRLSGAQRNQSWQITAKAENRFFVRVSGTDKASVEKVFGNVEYIDAQGVTGELGFVTEVMTEEALENKKQDMGKC